VAAVNPAGVGEYSHPQNLTFDCELHHKNYYDIANFFAPDNVIFKDSDNWNTLLSMIACTGCMDSTSSTTDMVIEPIPVSSGLSGEMSYKIILLSLSYY
jgi:hypothetical protein